MITLYGIKFLLLVNIYYIKIISIITGKDTVHNLYYLLIFEKYRNNKQYGDSRPYNVQIDADERRRERGKRIRYPSTLSANDEWYSLANV